MGLVDLTRTDTLAVPHEEGEFITIRSLLATEMDEAKEVRMKRVMDLWGDSLPSMSAGQQSEETEETLAQRVAQYDALTLLKYAVVSWSYEAPVHEVNINSSMILEQVERLDTVTRDWLVEEIVQRNTRPLASRKSSGGNSKQDIAHLSSSTLMPSSGAE
jgi:hypothetical protein